MTSRVAGMRTVALRLGGEPGIVVSRTTYASSTGGRPGGVSRSTARSRSWRYSYSGVNRAMPSKPGSPKANAAVR